MKLSVDFLMGRGTRRRNRAWVLAATVVFLVSLSAYVWTTRVSQGLADQLARVKYETVDAQRKRDELARSASRESGASVLRERYRASLPWTEVLDALEAIPKLQVAEVRFDVDSGEAVIELVGQDNDAVAGALEDLRQGLPRWRVQLVKALHAEGRASISLRLTDQLRPKTASTK